jgi:hypothetical protein
MDINGRIAYKSRLQGYLLDSHNSDTSQDAHQGKQLPENCPRQHLVSPNIYMRFFINIIPYIAFTRAQGGF